MFLKFGHKFETIDYSHIYSPAEQMVFQANESLDVKWNNIVSTRRITENRRRLWHGLHSHESPE